MASLKKICAWELLGANVLKNVRRKKVLDAVKYLVDTSELYRTEGIKVQNALVDVITSQSSTYEEWSEFVQNTNKSSADV